MRPPALLQFYPLITRKEALYMDLLNLILAVVVLVLIITAWEATRHTN
ncbi:hypothetical protein [Arthrobacter flavus]|uniref:Uncharacterized protein n=1 Tax=Arthrobacter flavus TaxID=95172 RepID=A0ABW4QBN1_9MICC